MVAGRWFDLVSLMLTSAEVIVSKVSEKGTDLFLRDDLKWMSRRGAKARLSKATLEIKKQEIRSCSYEFWIKIFTEIVVCCMLSRS